jgi:transcriptional regulator with XRE-family HTH domain
MAAKRVRLAQRRKAAGYSQEQLAAILGVERSTVVRWETAETEPQPWSRPKLAQALKVTPDKLQELLDDITITEAAPSDRLSHVLDHPSQVDLVVAAYLHERIRQLDTQYDRTPSASLLGPAGQVYGQVKLLRQNAKDNRVSRSLCEVEAEAATFMSQLVWDVSQRRDHTAALAYLDEAVAAARQVRDPAIEAYATLRKSFVALYGERDATKGVMLAE